MLQFQLAQGFYTLFFSLLRPKVADSIGSDRRPLKEQLSEIGHVIVEVDERSVKTSTDPRT